jgi:hypothetical protein
MKAMTTFLAAVLSTIAVGVLLIAYGLLAPRVATSDAAGVISDARLQYEAPSPSGPRAIQAVETYSAPRRIVTSSPPVNYSDRPARVERAPSRDWVKTAMIIGGSTAAGAGVGGIFGGKKGALIGAAIGGGASTIYEVQKR